MQAGIDEEEHEVLSVGCLSVEIEPQEQEVSSKFDLQIPAYTT